MWGVSESLSMPGQPSTSRSIDARVGRSSSCSSAGCPYACRVARTGTHRNSAHRAKARFLACTFARFTQSLFTEGGRSYLPGSSVNNGEQPSLAPVFYGPYDPCQHEGGRVYKDGGDDDPRD